VLRDTITAISHDLRTPLTTLNFYVYLLERMSDPTQQKEKLDGIKQQLTLLEHRINEILLSVRLEQHSDPSRNPVNLNIVCQNALLTLQPLIDMRKLAVVTQWQLGLPHVLGDETALRQAMDNLIQNAINYTPEGGTITLKTRIQGDDVSVEISDTGIGISENDLPYIFDHFFRADRSRSMNNAGMGLGLAIVKRIVEMHGGTIEVKSTVGQGTTFRVLLSILMAK
jgi:signal transduction histidine kinase